MLRNVHISKVNSKASHRCSIVAHNFYFICLFSSKNPHAKHFSAHRINNPQATIVHHFFNLKDAFSTSNHTQMLAKQWL